MPNYTASLKRALAFALSLSLLMVIIHDAKAAPPSEWLPRGPGGGGALFAPSFSPHNPNELYISCDMSEVFRSTNLGLSWDMQDFRQIQGNRESQVRFTGNPSISFAIDYTGDLARPSKSTDGGLTWKRLTNDPTSGEAFTLFTDPNSATNLIVSDYSHIYLSTDGGSTFTLKFTTSSGNGCFVAGAFFDGNTIYAGTNLGLLVSTNGGAFTAASVGGIPAAEAIVSFAGAKQGATVRFFAVTLTAGDVFPGLFTEGSYFSYQKIYSLDWGQANWTAKVTGIGANDFPFFVSMARNDISTAYAAGQAANEFPIIYKTTNGGTSWQSVLLTNNNQNIFTGWAGRGGDRDWSYGAGALGFAVSPVDANKAAFTDLGFAHITTDGGATWKQMYVNPADQNPMNALITKGRSYHSIGLEDTTCWWLTWKDANNLFASYSDIRGTRSTDGGASWSFNYTGQTYNSTYQSVKHPSTGAIYAGTSSVHDMYQSTRLQDSTLDSGNGAIKYSTDGGATWLTLHDFVHPVIGLALDPNNLNRMYASVIHSTQGGIYVSSNIQNGAASTWTKLANPPRTEGHPFNIHVLNDGTLVCTYSGRRNSAGTFTTSSGVFVSTNGGTSWVDRSHSGMHYWTKDLVIDPHDSTQNTWYASVFSGWGGPPNGLGGLYKTTNRGQAWTRIKNLDRVTSCAISPVNPNEMYLTTETEGLWYSSDLNAATPSFAAVTSYPFRQPERVFFNPFNPNEIWITSFGHGLRVGSVCGFSLSSSGNFFPERGGSGSVIVNGAGGCGWNAASNDNWIIITSADNGSGSATVTYEVRENFTANARTGTMTIAGQAFTVIQSSGLSDCRPTISPGATSFVASGGAGSVIVTAESGCAWGGISNVSWISITSGGMGIGNGTLNYSVAANTSGISRKGKITIGTQVFNVKQQ
ncbi:MAG: BACON domain-containing carbohydrate-binding protein [Blastocatellia bacterium]